MAPKIFDRIMRDRAAAAAAEGRKAKGAARPAAPEEGHRVQTPKSPRGDDPILRARDRANATGGPLSGAVGVEGAMLSYGKGHGLTPLPGILRESSRCVTPSNSRPATPDWEGIASPVNVDAVRDEAEEKKVRWEPSVRGGRGCAPSDFTLGGMLVGIGHATLRTASRVEDTAHRMSPIFDSLGMRCQSTGRFVCSGCDSDHAEEHTFGLGRCAVGEDELVVYQAGRDEKVIVSPRGEGRDDVAASREAEAGSRCCINDGLGGGLFASRDEEELVYGEGREDDAMRRDSVMESREGVRAREEKQGKGMDSKVRKQQYQKSTSLRESANNIETGMGNSVSAEEDPFSSSMHRYQRSPRASAAPSESVLGTRGAGFSNTAPVSSSRRRQGKTQDKYRTAPAGMQFTTKVRRDRESENDPSNVSTKPKKKLSRRVVGGLKKPLRFVAAGVRGHMKHSKSYLALTA